MLVVADARPLLTSKGLTFDIAALVCNHAVSCGAHSIDARSLARLTPKLIATVVASLLTAGLLVVATAAYASGSSCYGGSCESVTGTGLHISSTDTYADSPHCNQSLGTKQYDQKGYLSTYQIGPSYRSGCSTVPMPLNWNTTLPQNDNIYGQSYFSAKWQGIATVNVHS